MKKVSYLRLPAALFVAGVAILFERPKAALGKIGSAMLSWTLVAEERERVEDDVYEKRLKTCENCPIFYAPLQTCGSPLSKDFRGVGCYCYMPLKSVVSKAHCWLDETDSPHKEYGWTTNGAH